MRRDALRITADGLAKGLHVKRLLAVMQKDAGTALGFRRALTAAFGDLPRVPSQSRRRTAHQRDSRENRGISRSSTENDIRSAPDGLDVGLRTHRRDDVFATIDDSVR